MLSFPHKLISLHGLPNEMGRFWIMQIREFIEQQSAHVARN